MDADIALATTRGIRLVGADDREFLAGANVTSLAEGVDGVLWAVVDGHVLHRIDGDTSDAVASTDLSIECVQDHAGTVWCGTAGAHLLRVDGDRLEQVTSFDEAPTHEGWHTPWGGPPTVWSMAAHGDALYVNVHVGGILVTVDGGEHWGDTIDLHDDVHQVQVAPDGTLWAASGAGGLAASGDGGSTWRSFGRDLDEPYLRSVALTDRGAIVGGSVGPRARTASLYAFDGDGDGNAHRLGGGLPDRLGGNVDAYRLVSRGSVVVVADPGGAVHVSTDAGARWTTLVEDPGEVNAIVVR